MNTRMRVCHVLSHLDNEISGPSYSVPRLVGSLVDEDINAYIATLDRGREILSRYNVEIVKFRQSSKMKKLGISSDMKRWLQNDSSAIGDLVHSHGLWMMPNIYCGRCSVPHVVSPRGTLDAAALRYNRVGKELILRLGQRSTLKSASAFHATSQKEAEDIKNRGLGQRVYVIPNGIDIPEVVRRESERRVLYLGRIHQKKGIEMLLKAWHAIESSHPGWRLDIVGEGQRGYEDTLKNMVGSLGLERVLFHGGVIGSQKEEMYKRSDILVLPSYGENFGMVVAEALSYGIPVVTTDRTPWHGVIKNRCGWMCAATEGAIENSLATALSIGHEQRIAMGARGREWMKVEYSWKSIGQMTKEMYLDVLESAAQKR